MASDVYLIRRTANPRSVKYTAVTDVRLSGLRTAYASVTGVAATEIVTITGSTMADGMQVIFTSLTGGAGLSTGVAYFAVNSSGATCQLAIEEGGSAVNITTNITAGSVIVVNPQMRVWSSEFRDVFNGSSDLVYSASGASSSVLPVSTNLIYDGTVTITPPVGGVTPTGINVVPDSSPLGSNSDEVAHHPLRQTLVNRTFWIFDRGSSVAPRYLYAEYQSGDVIADNAPTS